MGLLLGEDPGGTGEAAQAAAPADREKAARAAYYDLAGPRPD
jgi:hypothetical protein